MPASYYSEKLDRAKHDRKAFSCGEPDLDRYFREQAVQDLSRRVAVPYVLVESASNRVAGYYTLSMRSFDRNTFPPDIAKKFPYRHIPVVLIGRLALNKDYQGKGWGWKLVADALYRAASASSEVAAFAVVVEAKNDSARSFYEHVGFSSMVDNPLALYIPVGSIATFE